MSRNTPQFPQLVVRRYDPQQLRRRVLLGAVAWVTTVLVTIAVMRWFAPVPIDGPSPAAFEQVKQENETLKQRVAVLERADQVDRIASSDLQQTLREREEEIAGLRTDIAFYSRLVGGGARREGLAVHSVHVSALKESRAWNVTVTLTQNLKRSQVSEGKVQVAIEGVNGGQLRSLPWSELSAGGEAGGMPFSFKYFQQVSGTVMLPEGFSPNRIKVLVDAGGGGRIEQGFAWDEAQAAEETQNVQQQEKSGAGTAR
ncbi:MAG TPA: DUF6776 family protein [Tahibacter sp.]|nr:DUF6776 family protein [Tahibacter sp.]